jgi:ABC-2 type transport system permease protein
MVLQSALESIAGSGHDRYRRFDDQADEYHAAYRSYFFNRIRRGESFRLRDVAEMPTFSFDDRPTAQVVQHVFWAIFCLLGFAFLLLMAAWPRYKNIGRLSN